MERLHSQRCFNHAGREAVARCPSCKRFYCRECVVEHDDKLICAACQKKLTATQKRRKPFWRAVARIAQAAAMFLLLWIFFFAAGRLLLSLPVKLHDGTFWTKAEDDQ